MRRKRRRRGAISRRGGDPTRHPATGLWHFFCLDEWRWGPGNYHSSLALVSVLVWSVSDVSNRSLTVVTCKFGYRSFAMTLVSATLSKNSVNGVEKVRGRRYCCSSVKTAWTTTTHKSAQILLLMVTQALNIPLQRCGFVRRVKRVATSPEETGLVIGRRINKLVDGSLFS